MPADSASFSWTPQPQTASALGQIVEEAVARSPWLGSFSQRLRERTGTRLIDWLDHIALPADDKLPAIGFHQTNFDWWECEAGLFPRIRIDPRLEQTRLALRVEDVGDFTAAHAEVPAQIDGPAGAAVRIATLQPEPQLSVLGVERHGNLQPACTADAVPAEELAAAGTLFRTRPRDPGRAEDAFQEATARFAKVRDSLGLHRACDLFFQHERSYWQSRNHAARVQRERQEQLGLGWANHDHHTYRCSRQHFARLIAFLEQTGFVCRERFYAGAEAGWGAQVLEQPTCGLVVFADVDLSEAEVSEDFAHQGLRAQQELGTVGLWCALHGDSFLSAGMHHLECQFDFDAAREQLQALGVPTMAPFTDFPHLRQAFTVGERWTVARQRLDTALQAGQLTESQVERFAADGAIGSHLEILERNDGYKGFNQTGISKIIRETNPMSARP